MILASKIAVSMELGSLRICSNFKLNKKGTFMQKWSWRWTFWRAIPRRLKMNRAEFEEPRLTFDFYGPENAVEKTMLCSPFYGILVLTIFSLRSSGSQSHCLPWELLYNITKVAAHSHETWPKIRWLRIQQSLDRIVSGNIPLFRTYFICLLYLYVVPLQLNFLVLFWEDD